MKRKIPWIVGAVSVSIIAYYSYAVVDARARTPEIFETAKAQVKVPLFRKDLSDEQLKLLLNVQDRQFFEHGGTDFQNGRITTITQALVKFLYFERFKPGIAKIKQSLIADFALDSLVSKDDQLHLFLSLAYFGDYEGKAVRGFGEASQTYFQKPFAQLTQNEYIQLLAMLSGPNEFNVKLHPAKNAEQVASIRSQIGE